MKLSNLSVIFIVVAIPLVLLLSYYISLQRDTINLQTEYNTKLLESTKEAIEAFEINTVEWNEAYSETEDSKRRDILAAINTFTTSLANNLGVSGTSKEFLLTNIPAVAFTLYDGLYIYTPSRVKTTVMDENGVTVRMSEAVAGACGGEYVYTEEDEGKILYRSDTNPDGEYIYTYTDSNGIVQTVRQNFTLDSSEVGIETEDKHILKPFTPYTETLKDFAGNDWVISYTLDNYITVYGGNPTDYTSDSGYLNITSSTPDGRDNVIYISGTNFTNKSISGITFSGREIDPEKLSETIAYKNATGAIVTGEFNYVYESQKDTKIYYDGHEFFRLNNDLEKVYIKDLTEPLYKKCTVPAKVGGEDKYIKVYQSLVKNPAGSYTWYVKPDGRDEYYATDVSAWHPSFSDPVFDYSAINYCVETFVFTNWINSLSLGPELEIDINNDPELEESRFVEHKKEIIRNVIVSNLNQAITSYSRNRAETYRLPMLKETEWDQVLSNVSIITFLQNIPIGLKYYNNYALATSTLNKEFVDPNELYIYDKETPVGQDTIYHSPYCSELADSDKLIGYRSIDFLYKNYKQGEDTKYYFRHSNRTLTGEEEPITQSCYYCLVQRALYEEDITNNKKDAYYTTLARERYIQLDEPIIGEETIELKVVKDVDNIVKKYGENIKYTITVTNNSTNDKIVNIEDTFENYNVTDYMENISVNEGTLAISGKTITVSGISLSVGETKTIEITGKVKGRVGIHTNTAKARIDGHAQEFISNTVQVKVVKDIKIVSEPIPGPTNVVFIIDASASMVGPRINNVQDAVKNFVNKMANDGKSQIGYVKFYTIGLWFMALPYGDAKGPYMIENRNSFINSLEFGADGNLISATPFATGIRRGKELLQEMKNSAPENMNIAIFLSDGVNFYWEVPNYRTRADELQDVADRVYAIGYRAELATNFDTLRDDIASKQEYFKESNNMDQVFNEIFTEISDSVEESIDGSNYLDETININGTGASMIGNWVSLKNDSNYGFTIDATGKVKGIDITSTIVRIKVDGTTIEEDTLLGLSNKGYIGKAYDSVYLNLNKFEASDGITIEIAQ